MHVVRSGIKAVCLETPSLTLSQLQENKLKTLLGTLQKACVASVSVRLSARSMHFSLFWPRENWGGRKKVRGGGGERRDFSPFPSPVTHFFALAPIFARLKNKKCLERAENLTETLATQATLQRPHWGGGGVLRIPYSFNFSLKYSISP